MNDSKSVQSYSDIDKFKAYNLYLGECSGDLELISRKMGHVPIAILKKWESSFGWKSELEALHLSLKQSIQDDEIKRREDNLKILRFVRNKLLDQINGIKNAEGEILQLPLKAKTLESASESIVNIMRMESELLGDDLGSERGKRAAEGFVQFIFNKVQGDLKQETPPPPELKSSDDE